jgi:hypothetical protein
LHFSTFGNYDNFNPTIPSFSYLDLEANWQVNRIVQIRAGANNVLDKDPPIINNAIIAGGGANTYDAYDQFGRQLFVAFTAKFWIALPVCSNCGPSGPQFRPKTALGSVKTPLYRP